MSDMAIVPVRYEDLSEEDNFWKVLSDMQEHIRKAQEHDLRARWWFGHILLDADVPVIDVSNRYGLDPSEVYRRIAFARMVPTINDFDKLLNERPALTWTYTIRKLLPSVSKDPSSVGGASRQVDKVVGIAEASAMLCEDFADHAPEDKMLRQEAASGLAVAGSRMIEAAQSLQQDVELEIPHAPQAPTFDPDNATKGMINTLQHFYRTTQSCVICGKEASWDERLEFHHWPHTRGAGGKDWQGVPICGGECHQYAQENPEAFWNTYKDAITLHKDCLIFQLLMEVSGAEGATR